MVGDGDWMVVIIERLSQVSKVRRSLQFQVRANRVRDLQSAKHRHSSTQKPLGRFILFTDALLSTAQEIVPSLIWLLIFKVFFKS